MNELDHLTEKLTIFFQSPAVAGLPTWDQVWMAVGAPEWAFERSDCQFEYNRW